MQENNLLSKYGGTVFAKITAFLILDIFFLNHDRHICYQSHQDALYVWGEDACIVTIK